MAAASLPAQTVLTLDGASGAVSHATARSTDGGLSIGLTFAIDYLIIGGGGSGGYATPQSQGVDGTGGGGAGGFLEGSSTLGASSYAVSVGAGGVGTNTGINESRGGAGGNSTFLGLTAIGGGGGGGYSIAGGTGGSGGGGGGRNSAAGGAPTAGQGFVGGVAQSGNTSGQSAGGGGGGAGGPGQAGDSAENGGDGGIGKISTITGQSVYYAGGGAGAGINGLTAGVDSQGLGGLGGGGDASRTGVPGNGTNGLGGGGGGAGNGANNDVGRLGGNGGSGVVIVRYLGAAAGTGGAVSAGTGSALGYTLHTFATVGAGTLNLSGLNLSTRLGAVQDAAISGSGDLTFTGPGRLELNSANTYSGKTVVNAGTVALGASGSLHASTVLSVASGAAFDLNGRTQTVAGVEGLGELRLGSGALTVDDATDRTFFGAISGSGSLAKSGAGTLTLAAASSHTGGTVVNGGVLRLGPSASLAATGGLTLGASGSFDLNGLTQTLAFLDGSGTIALGAGALTVNDASSRSFSGAISGTGSLTKSGAGTLTLSGASAYSGGTTLSAGELRAGSDTALGSGTLVLNAGRLASSSSSARTLANNLAVGAAIALGHATDNGALTLSGAVDLGGVTRALTVDSDVTLGGVVSNGGLTKSGAGTLTLSGANTYTGNTVVSAGTLAIGSAGSIGDSSSVQVAAGATLDVSAGSGFTLASGQSLSGGGTVAGDTVIAGTHTPGFSPGLQIFTDNLTYANGATVVWELAANSTSGRGVSFDGIDVQGDLAFQGTVNLSLVFSAAGGAVDWSNAFWASAAFGAQGWKVFDVTGSISGFDNLQITAVDWLDSQGVALSSARPEGVFSLSQNASGVYLNYNPVPEPSTYGLLLGGLALAGAALLRRRRQGS